MLGKRLSESMSGIGDDLIADAMEYRAEKKRNVWLRVAAVAAVVVMVLTWLLWPGKPDVSEDDGVVKAPGMLRVYAFDLTSGEDIDDCKSYVLEEGDETTHIGWWDPSVGRAMIGLPIRLSFEGDDFAECEITFDVTSEHGDFYMGYVRAAERESAWLGKEFSVKNHEIIYWRNKEEGKTGKIIDDKGYVDIVIRADGNIVGYTVVKIVRARPEYSVFLAYLVENVTYPMVNGEYQQITEEYVWEQMLKGR